MAGTTSCLREVSKDPGRHLTNCARLGGFCNFILVMTSDMVRPYVITCSSVHYKFNHLFASSSTVRRDIVTNGTSDEQYNNHTFRAIGRLSDRTIQSLNLPSRPIDPAFRQPSDRMSERLYDQAINLTRRLIDSSFK